MGQRLTALGLFFVVCIPGCMPRGDGETALHKASTGPPLVLPATFSGVLPCAHCPGIRYTLNLRPDNVFFLRRTYLGIGEGDDPSFYDFGSWLLSAHGKTLILRGGREASLMFAVKSAHVLRKLDLEGREIRSHLNYDLIRAESFEPLEVVGHMRAMYMYMADAGMLTECITGKRFPVAQEQDNAALEAAYLKARSAPGEPLLVNLEGRIALRPRMEGTGEHEVVVVERFINVRPGETCGPRFSAAELENTYWKLVRLGDQPVQVAAQEREPHLILQAESRRIAGSGGCNRLIGGYELEGEQLTFGQLATTRMACPDVMELEDAFLRALELAAQWNILDDHLELYDRTGRLLARFEARDME